MMAGETDVRFVRNQNTKIWTCCSGKGLPLLLCSGGPGAADYLGPVASMLEDKAFSIRFDQRGCGRSSKEGPYDLETTLSDLECVRKHYRINGWIVVGHSWGANLALAYAIEKPERTRGLIYMCGNGAQHDIEWRDVYRAARSRHEEILPDMEFPGNEQVNRDGNRSWYSYIRRRMFLRRVAELDLPVLFIHAENDMRPLWPARQLAALVPDAEETIVKGAGHYIWLTHADELGSILRSFIERNL